MTSPLSVPSDVAFSPAVKAIQARKGSRAGYRRLEETGGWRDAITPDLAAFLAAQTSMYLATASAAGQPYIQHRGGPAGFLRVLDDHTIAFADFKGNRQYITLGNLSENPAAHIFLMDYANRRRIKMWGTARAVEDDPALLESLRVAGYKGVPEQALVFTLTAWDMNCPQHIPQRFEAADVAAALEARDRRIAELEAQLARLGNGAG
ncbi:pyridoxamine 5'-phosphate oxidase family protein [Roseixanthobacter liquoris]|uniref:pyridoxamine 5'-phosphate oxidase family protein n=1 Tax=Roseixanthobacter liquoris TaxID=3119921 RepID=UPI003729D3EC